MLACYMGWIEVSARVRADGPGVGDSGVNGAGADGIGVGDVAVGEGPIEEIGIEAQDFQSFLPKSESICRLIWYEANSSLS